MAFEYLHHHNLSDVIAQSMIASMVNIVIGLTSEQLATKVFGVKDKSTVTQVALLLLMLIIIWWLNLHRPAHHPPRQPSSQPMK